MRELRFDKAVYLGEAVDEAKKTFEDYAEFELGEDEGAWIVKVTAKKPKLERRIAGELGNFALGLTIKNRGIR